MYKFKYTIPLKRDNIVKGFCSIMGKEDKGVISLNLKQKIDDGAKLVIVKGETNEIKVFDLSNEITTRDNLNGYNVCCVVTLADSGVNYEMVGNISGKKYNFNKLQGILNMKMYTAKEEEQIEEPVEEIVEQVEEITQSPKPNKEPQELYDYIDSMEESELDIGKELETCQKTKCEFVNPFANRWEGVWYKIEYEDKGWHYLVGKVRIDGHDLNAIAIPGVRYQKPDYLHKFDLYAVADNGSGYWVMLQKK